MPCEHRVQSGHGEHSGQKARCGTGHSVRGRCNAGSSIHLECIPELCQGSEGMCQFVGDADTEGTHMAGGEYRE